MAGGAPTDGAVFVATGGEGRRGPLSLPGFTIHPVDAPLRLPGDMAMPSGLFISGAVRCLVENIDVRGRPARHRSGTAAVEDRIDDLARSGGAGAVQAALAQLDQIAGDLDPAAVEAVRRRLAAVLGSLPAAGLPVSSRLSSRLDGRPVDHRRLDLFTALAEVLDRRAPRPIPTIGDDAGRAWLPFFEAYFSNFIEGTEFSVDEARRIVLDDVVPSDRPADAHDVTATYRLALDPSDRSQTPRTGVELLELLVERHRILMAARPEKRPGELKRLRNHAGGYEFVEPDLVVGTLEAGFEIVDRLTDPFARASALMAVITECHPFDDGNGRVARLTANAELTAAGQARIVIPTVFRTDYLAGLAGLSRGVGNGEALAAVLAFAQRWTGSMDWSTYEGAVRSLTEVNAFMDPRLADASGLRLQLPR